MLDEADRILDLGFAATLNAILENIPEERQTLLYSATQTRFGIFQECSTGCNKLISKNNLLNLPFLCFMFYVFALALSKSEWN